MKAESLDLLEKSELRPAQARAILQAMDLELSTERGTLATQSDLHYEIRNLESGLRAEIQSLRAEMHREIKASIRWNFFFWVTQLGAVVALIKFVR